MLLNCFTDGSCINNGKKNAIAAWACVWPEYQEFNESSKLSSNELHTNNRAEYLACLNAFKIADKIDPTRVYTLVIYTDSMLLLNSMTKWINGWKTNGWKTKTSEPVKNQDLLKSIDYQMQLRPYRFNYVPAHTNKKDWHSIYNDEADRLAKAEVSRYSNQKQTYPPIKNIETILPIQSSPTQLNHTLQQTRLTKWFTRL